MHAARLLTMLALTLVSSAAASQPLLIPVTHKRPLQGSLVSTREASSAIQNKGTGGDYTIPITIGTPGTTFHVTLDTGSAMTAVAGCGNGFSTTTCWTPSDSSTSQDQGQSASSSYVTGGWSGEWYTDVVSFGGNQGLNNGQSYSATSWVAAISSGSDFFESKSPNVEGIMGLAYSSLNNNNPTVIESIIQANSLPNQFALYLCPSVSGQSGSLGYLVVGGGADQASLYSGSFQWTPVLQESYYNVAITSLAVGGTPLTSLDSVFAANNPDSSTNNDIIDSGYATLGLQDAVYNGIVSALTDAGCGPADIFNGYAVPTITPDISQWPTLTFTLQGGTTLDMPPHAYLQFQSSGCSLYSFQISNAGAVSGNALGNPLLNNYYTVFDRANSRVGFAAIANTDTFCGSSQDTAAELDCGLKRRYHEGVGTSTSSRVDPTVLGAGLGAALAFVVVAAAVVVVVRHRRRRQGDQELETLADTVEGGPAAPQPLAMV